MYQKGELHGLCSEPCTRLTSWYTMPPCSCVYKYGHSTSITPTHLEHCPSFMKLWRLMEDIVGLPFNCCNISYYGTQFDWVPFHQDNESLFFDPDDKNTVIVSCSILCQREFKLRCSRTHIKYSAYTNQYDFLVMTGQFQKDFYHKVAEIPDECGPRINFTWRFIREHNDSCPLFTDTFIPYSPSLHGDLFANW